MKEVYHILSYQELERLLKLEQEKVKKLEQELEIFKKNQS